MKANTASHPGLVLGAVFLSLFGATWLLGWSWQAPGSGFLLRFVIVLGALALVAWAIRSFRQRRAIYVGRPDPMAQKRIRKALILINIAQWSSIGALVLGLNAVSHIEWIMPAVILVVGLHFVPMAKVFHYRGYYLTALALVVVALAYCLAGANDQRSALSLLATGTILWVTALFLLVRE